MLFDAPVVVVDDAGHLMFTDQPEASLAAVRRYRCRRAPLDASTTSAKEASAAAPPPVERPELAPRRGSARRQTPDARRR
ncbi:MAG: hypothetical protein R3A79_10560 [Nannocystaceae bacterium]